jgi:diguanylate cyclase (GGDEF)-like protein
MTGWSSGEAVGRFFADVFNAIDGETRLPVQNPLELAMQHGMTTHLQANTTLIRRDGVESPIEDSAALIHDASGQMTGGVLVFRDVSAAQAMSLKLSHMAQYDELTNLPNRTLFNDRLAQAIALAGRQGTCLALLFVDLDRFKQVNDSLGHAVGDALLQSVAERLRSCVRRSDTVSRHGGDEFLVLLSHVKHAEDAVLSADKMIAALMAPHRVLDFDLIGTASVGVSVYPDDGQTAETLISASDAAMYHAKQNGRNNRQRFRAEMNTRSADRQLVERSLRGAAERDELVLHYQPMIDLEARAMTGIEALVRWRHPERGLVWPREFVPIAEESGLIVPIGRWVLRQACCQARAWQDAGLPAMPIAVNVSATEFRARGFLEHVRIALEEARLEPRYLEFELTESVLMEDAASTISLLRGLKDMGVQLAVDDFGTGYSSLSYLSRFPIDILKIDQSFVQAITADPNAAAIVSAVINMGSSLHQRVIAEGVETREQLAVLQAHHCAEGQGFYFSPPVSAEEFAELLANSKEPAPAPA